MKRQWIAISALAVGVSFLLGLVAAGPIPAAASAPRVSSDVAAKSVPVGMGATVTPTGPTSGAIDFASVAARLNAAVVNVDSAVRGDEGSRLVLPGRPVEEGPREGSGSGFIIDPAGYILTNYHVIDSADRITVTLGDGRVFKASVVGIDPAIDVALLQVPTTDPLPVAPLGNSDTLRVGEWVCAIGNPLGFVHSVTVGVVSFLGRKVFDQMDALIQTDASITFGNSGGPLINAHGQVVGIATARSAQSSNIGFAVPISQVIAVLPQLRTRGRVSRGYIGVTLTSVTSALQRALDFSPASGALVQEVTGDSPAARAGLRTYDVITAIDGRAVASDDELTRYISGHAPGTVSQLDVWRDGQLRAVSIKLEERPSPRSDVVDSAKVEPASRDDSPLGLAVHELDPTTVKHLSLPDAVTGVVITDVDPAGPARVTSIRRGQVLIEINRQPVATAAAYRAVMGGLRPGESVAVLVYDPLLKQHAIYTITLDPQS